MNLRKEARGRNCMIRIPGICNHNPETTVLAHLNGGGLAMKRPDAIGSWACSACHDEVDGRTQITRLDGELLRLMFLEGIVRTQEALISEGKLKW